ARGAGGAAGGGETPRIGGQPTGPSWPRGGLKPAGGAPPASAAAARTASPPGPSLTRTASAAASSSGSTSVLGVRFRRADTALTSLIGSQGSGACAGPFPIPLSIRTCGSPAYGLPMIFCAWLRCPWIADGDRAARGG